MDQFDIHPSWAKILKEEFEQAYFKNIQDQLEAETKAGKLIYPKKEERLNAFKFTSFDGLKVIIIGQDPYHGPGQAHGLSFSVQEGNRIPPSLLNIYKELESDLDIPRRENGNLEAWAAQGVFLLNAILSVRAHEAASHRQLGWQTFTDKVIELISDRKENVVFLLWGAFAQKKEELINSDRHLILKSAHPSPLSARRGFFGCKHFSKANEFLSLHGISPIAW